MILGVARLVMDEERSVQEFMADVRRLPALVDPRWPVRAPEVAEDAWRLLIARAGDPDPLRDVKRHQNELAAQLSGPVRQRVATADDPFALAVKFAAAGNILDAMVDVTRGPGDDFIETVAALPGDPERVQEFRRRVTEARRIVYLTDNCGEIVFDRLLLEVIRTFCDPQVTVVVRSLPTLNDATLVEAREVGLHEVADVVENGIDTPLPATSLARVSPQVRALIDQADLVVSKGGANYEFLEDEGSLEGKTTFVLFGKCDPLCGAHHVARGDLILLNA